MTNAEAIGYALLAAKAFGMTKNQMKLFESELRHQMDIKTDSEALSYYYNYEWEDE